MTGEIPGIPPNTTFASRRELHDSCVHRGLQRGIGAAGESIVLSGGYIDDVDDGDTIIYTGEGGRDLGTGRQITDQILSRGNLALAQHWRKGNPIRVCRGSSLDSGHAPPAGYRYDGLYRIESCWSETGIDGFLIWRYRLVRIPKAEQLPGGGPSSLPGGQQQPERSTVTTTRVIRNSDIGNYVKNLYDHTCQISGVRLETPTGPYAEACHLRPVGKPHDGPDVVENVICLSPNMHVLFDLGAIALTDNLDVIGIEGKLMVHPEHTISLEHVGYHREHIYSGT